METREMTDLTFLTADQKIEAVARWLLIELAVPML